MIVPGRASQSVAAALAATTGRELAAVSFDCFPDGERLAAVPGFDADEAVIVAATPTPAAHIELLQLQDAVREAGAREIHTVIPYMGYARQDKPMAPGEPSAASPTGYPISARAVSRAIASGTDRVTVVSPHERSVLDFFDVPGEAVDGAPALATGLPNDLADPLIVAPDKGARSMADQVRTAYGQGSVDHFVKTRHDPETVSIEPNDADPAGRDAVIVDDIIATGGTASQAVRTLTDRGADRVVVACVHAVLAGDARTKLARAGIADLVATDTIEGPASRVSVAPAVAAALENGKP